MKTERANLLAQGLEGKVRARPKQWKLNRKHVNVDPCTIETHWSSADESSLVYVAIKDDAQTALSALRSSSVSSSGKEPEQVQNLGENACLLRGKNGCTLFIQIGDVFISISAATEKRAREFAEDVLASLPGR